VTADEFAIRYYRWAIVDSQREADNDFPLIGAIRGTLAVRAVAFLRSLDIVERRRAAEALVKRVHRRAVELTGDTWSAADTAFDERYRASIRAPQMADTHAHPAVADGSPASSVNRRQLLVAVKEALAPVLGPGEPFSTKHEWRYATPFDRWTLVTLIDVGGSTHQLSYSQSIQSAPHRYVKEGISVLSWLGLGGAQTQWNQLTGFDVDSAAGALSRVCSHFVNAAPGLLHGLTPDS
jgi:hypothetical protein